MSRMSDRPRFSVIVPTYNRPHFLSEALESIRAQTISDFECIVVDDASHTAAPVIPDDPRFRLIALNENVGGTKARQIGCNHAIGDALCFLDDDDAWTVDRLKLAEEGLRRAPLSICWSRPLNQPNLAGNGRRLEGDVSGTIVNNYTPPMATVAILRSTFLPFNAGFQACEDIDWWIRQASQTMVTTTPTVGFLHRSHTGHRNANGTIARIDSSYQLLSEHHEYFDDRPRARAFRWRRIGGMQAAIGKRTAARQAYRKSISIRPSVRTLLDFVRTYRWPDGRRS